MGVGGSEATLHGLRHLRPSAVSLSVFIRVHSCPFAVGLFCVLRGLAGNDLARAMMKFRLCGLCDLAVN
jgi:hypothetical protein